MAIKLVIRRQGDLPNPQRPDEQTFDDAFISIGSDQGATLRLQGSSIAPEQAVVIREGNQLLLINRANGTELNGENLMREARRPLSDGDQLQVGQHIISFIFGETTHPSNSLARPPAEASAPTVAPTSETAPKPDAGSREQPSPQRNFAAILDSLRTEEDSFYLVIEGGTMAKRRVTIQSTVMLLGWDESELNISFDANRIVKPLAIMRKDWSGVVIEGMRGSVMHINGVTVDAVSRLRDGDHIAFQPEGAVAAPGSAFLVFHEPASLVVLDSILPQKLPPPLPFEAQALAAGARGAESQAASVAAAHAHVGLLSPDRRFFGYFTLLELMVMAVGTLAAAVVVFLLLIYIWPTR